MSVLGAIPTEIFSDHIGWSHYRKPDGEAKTVLAHGCFDLLHPGHLHTLAWAREQGDVLVVAVNDDAGVARLKGAGRPAIPLEQRCRMLAALSCVDYVTAFSEGTPLALIKRLKPSAVVKGHEYAGREREVPGHGLCLVLIAPESGFALHSSDLLAMGNSNH